MPLYKTFLDKVGSTSFSDHQRTNFPGVHLYTIHHLCLHIFRTRKRWSVQCNIVSKCREDRNNNRWGLRSLVSSLPPECQQWMIETILYFCLASALLGNSWILYEYLLRIDCYIATNCMQYRYFQSNYAVAMFAFYKRSHHTKAPLSSVK